MVGEHGDSSVALWSSMSVGGVPILSQLTNDKAVVEQGVLEKIRKAVVESAYEVIRLKGYTSWAIGYSVANLARSLLRDQHSIHPVSLLAKGFYGIPDDREVFLSLPAQLGRSGILSVANIHLSDEEAARLRRSANTLRQARGVGISRGMLLQVKEVHGEEEITSLHPHFSGLQDSYHVKKGVEEKKRGRLHCNSTSKRGFRCKRKVMRVALQFQVEKRKEVGEACEPSPRAPVSRGELQTKLRWVREFGGDRSGIFGGFCGSGGGVADSSMGGGMPLALQEKGAPLQVLEGEEGLFCCAASSSTAADNSNSNRKRKERADEQERLVLEPRSVLESLRSPSPPSSASTLSPTRGGGGGVPASSGGSDSATPSAAEEARRKEELPPVPANEEFSLGGVWEDLLLEQAAFIGQDQTFLRWIISEADNTSYVGHGGTRSHFDPALEVEGASVSAEVINHLPLTSSVLSTSGATFGCGSVNPNSCFPPPAASTLPVPLSPMQPGVLFQESTEGKPFLCPSLLLAQQQQARFPHQSSFFLPLHQFAGHHGGQPPRHLGPSPRRPPAAHPFPISRAPELRRPNTPQQPGFSRQFNASACEPQPPPAKPKLASGDEAPAAAAAAAQQQQALSDHLFKAAELIEAGNTVSARGILARLNHQLPFPVGKPLLRSAFYFKEALHLLARHFPQPPPPLPNPISTPLDVVLKLGTYKTFSDVSPIVQFAIFTCIQPLLEALDGGRCIHIIDFDIGVGIQWSVFMQELARRWSSTMAATPCLKISAFTSSCTHHPLELHLIHQNLCHFAGSLNIPFEFNFLSLDPFDPSVLLRRCSVVDEAIAVNLPVGWAISPPIPTLIDFVKQLSPKILVSVDHGCDRIDLPFAHHILHAFQSLTVLLDSIDAAGANQAAAKFEQFLVRPRVESAVLGHHCLSEKMLPWRTLFESAGFVPMHFSNFAEMQAESLLKRVLARGFHVEKHQSSLSLCWQHGELVSVSAWKC
ncbi:hypothetical protein BHM03_00007222 [Ensete ventricosum]|nr:hypothetical protein BHM03_00007222 [Ensete ventricosum]